MQTRIQEKINCEYTTVVGFHKLVIVKLFVFYQVVNRFTFFTLQLQNCIQIYMNLKDC